ncbi:replication factor C small subunit [Encephalitozoon hellem ATCC 50504]|uniref:Replication factor C n=1 Tax=Encephalitozoon hellem TaxID=27973 RepID=A0A9Q9F7L6_ENCHE|nr:replication factor C small subunit [Encephalitozoon hellem ATCC 50504]AFM97779.1 replication factor C small subunit [Encephalitozoon hellem ATCC 50504]UTX42549.1 replication factor C [Encephalitozoon hellem]|eukprot:XP_003886760.1 replication factor C small subunit [Encephalitozoon hellem ATCC 50504]
MHQPWTEKYRPRSLLEVVGNREVVAALQSIADAGKIPNMLFYGPPGTGKTTSIRAIANSLPRSCVLELNASDERGIATVRETIKDFASTYSKVTKLVILDEADMMSRDAQNALRRIIEDFSANTRFCLIANHSKKIIPPILSRCTKFRFGPIEGTEGRIEEICKREGIRYTSKGITALAKISEGDMRKAVNDVQGISLSLGVVDEENVHKFNGIAPVQVYEELFMDLKSMSMSELRTRLEDLKYEYGMDCNALIENLSGIVRKSRMRNKMKMLKEMGDIERRMSIGCNEKLQLDAIISVFILNRDDSL